MASVVEHLPSEHEALSSNPRKEGKREGGKERRKEGGKKEKERNSHGTAIPL
jgi:hypothetical protein